MNMANWRCRYGAHADHSRAFHADGALGLPALMPDLSHAQVHAYAAAPNGRTAYLSELESGTEVLIANAEGSLRQAVVGRCKVERRPLVGRDTQLLCCCSKGACAAQLALAELLSGAAGTCSDQPEAQELVDGPMVVAAASKRYRNPILCLQVLVEAATPDEQRHSILLQNAETVRLVGPVDANGWRSIPVTQLQQGDELLVHLQGAARHTGVSIQEQIAEQ